MGLGRQSSGSRPIILIELDYGFCKKCQTTVFTEMEIVDECCDECKSAS